MAGDAISRAPSLAGLVADRMRQEIVSGTYIVGDRLPTEKELAEKYAVSRPIIREALGTLKRDGLVATRQGLGTFIIETKELSFRFNGFELNDVDDIRNVIELLMSIEGAATGLAAERRTAAQLRQIEAQLFAMQQAIEANEAGVEEDIAFHQAIINACGNPYFQEMSRFLDGRVRNFIRAARTNTARQNRELVLKVQQEHRAIFDAIAAQDRAEARAAAEAHLAAAADRLALHLSI